MINIGYVYIKYNHFEFSAQKKHKLFDKLPNITNYLTAIVY